MIEAACDNGYMTEIFTTYLDDEEQYHTEISAVRSHHRWHLLRHRTPLRAGLTTFSRGQVRT